ncbi:MAG TPA: type I polyketide synthase [Streptomyces sp.]
MPATSSDLVRPLPELLRGHAESRGTKIAYSDARRAVTHADLERRTARLGGHLAGLGLPRGSRVAILLGNRVEIVESYLGVNRAGCVAVPVNPHFSDAELAHVLTDSDALAVLTDTAHAAQVHAVLPPGERHVIVVDDGHKDYEDVVTRDPATPPRDDLGLDEPAFLLYTSGTSGLPKGVLSTLRAALWNTTACYRPIIELSPDDTLLWPLPLFHSFGHSLGVLAVTAVGASAHLVPGFSAAEVLTELRARPYSFLVGVPTMYHNLVHAAGTEGLTLPALRVCLVAGSVTAPALAESFRSTFGIQLTDHYGSTETSGPMATMRPGDAPRPGSCGRPLPGLDVRVVDPGTGTDVPTGAEGEVWVKGPNVMLGYHNRPDATAKALKGGWYHTGDLARRDTDGYLWITGRRDNVIIRGGENVHPTEIEAVLLKVPGVRDAAAFGRDDEEFGQVPVALVVPGPDGVDCADLFARCRRELAYFKVPVEVRATAALPKTTTGKVLRRLLPDLPGRLLGVPGAHEGLHLVQPGGEPVPVPGATPLRSYAGQDVTVTGDDTRLVGLLAAHLTDGHGAHLTENGTPVTVTGSTVTVAETTLTLAEGLTDRRIRDALDVALSRPGATLVTALRSAAPEELPERADLTGPDLDRTLLDVVTREAAVVLADSTPVAPDLALREYGLTSADAVRLRDRVAAAVGLRLPTTLVFDHPSVRAIAAYVKTELTGASEEPTEAAPETAPDDDPVVLVGLACRYPGGVTTPDDLWRLVAEETDATSGFPEDRGWDLERLTAGSATGRGGFLHDAGDFDAEFFGISPREALATDPQQRLLLELAWEALERAGVDPATLRGEQVGVYAGLMLHDYIGDTSRIPRELEGYLATGVQGGVASGRIAYTLGLRGPALTVDTACSSSLVALHLAAQAIRRGECALALAGGVAVMGTPQSFLEFSKQAALAEDGRCKPFAAAADGTGWAEGAGLVVLERLSAARRAGHPVLAVLRGSAVNQDGASNGLTAPSGTAQREVIRLALKDAGLQPDDVDAVEAHGTGTRLGDPIEAGALLATYGQGRREPLWLGSLKSNIGHAQAAGGVGGVIKVVQAMRHRTLPRTLHVDAPTPHVDWTAGDVRLLTESMPWPERGRPARAAVSSFGISGTNAHVILEEPPAEPGPTTAAPAPDAVALPLHAKSPERLRDWAARLLPATAATHPAALAHSLATTRTRFPHRAVVIGADNGQLLTGVRAVADGTPAPNVVTGTADIDGKTVFVFPGHGSQWAGMAAGLMGESVFAESLLACERALAPHVDWSLTDVLADPERLERTDVVQPALFAVGVSLAALWRAHGVEPDAVLGHSVGEIAAACVAGALTLQEAARIVAVRGQVIAGLGGGTGMVAVSAPPEQVDWLVERWPDRLWVAGLNGPNSTTVAGDDLALKGLLTECALDGVHARRVRIGYASHSPRMEPLREEFLARLGEVRTAEPTVPMYSTTDLEWADASCLTAAYWYRNLREPVRLRPAVDHLTELGFRVFVESGGHPVLTPAIEETLDDTGTTAVVTGTLRRDDGGPARFLASAARLYVRGVDGVRLTPATGRPVTLPTTPFRRRRYWLTSGAAPRTGGGHPLLGVPVESARSGELVATSRISPVDQPWLADHAVGGTCLLPGTALLDLALRAAGGTVGELVIQAPLVLSRQGTAQLQVVLDPAQGTVEVFSRSGRPGSRWQRHAHGTVHGDVPGPFSPVLPPAGAERLDFDYASLAGLGYEYGPAFQGVRALWRRGEELFAELRLPEEAPGGFAGAGLHPVLGDAALHALAFTGPASAEGEVRLPFVWRDVWAGDRQDTEAYARLVPEGQDVVVEVSSLDGEPMFRGTLGMRTVALRELTGAVPTDSVLRVRWVEVAGEAGGPGAGVSGVEAGGVEVYAPPAGDVRKATLDTLSRLQQWLADEDGPLVVLTRTDDLAHAAARGLVRSAQAEHPGRFLVVETDDDPRSAGRVGDAVAVSRPHVRIAGGRLQEPELARVAPARGERPDLSGGTVLVTGGTGTLGSLVARHLVTEYGVRSLLLTSRRGGGEALAGELRELGADVVVAACDVADREALADALSLVPAGFPLVGVVHAAGVLADGVVTGMTADQVEEVLRPKVDGVLNLHELTKDAGLAAFVLFSSVAGVLGSPGQGNYAAANAFLDAFAERRRAEGLPVQAQAWSFWEEISGMTAVVRDRDFPDGTLPLPTPFALALFDEALRQNEPTLTLASFDLAKLRQRGAPALLRALLPPTPATTPALNLRTLPPAERAERLLTEVRSIAAQLLGHDDPTSLSLDADLQEFGLDSLNAVELRNRLSTLTGLRLPATLVFDHSVLRGLAERLDRELGAEVSAGAGE